MATKVLRYTIKTVIEVPADDPDAISEVTSVLEKGRELGTAEILSVQVVKPAVEKEV